MRPPKAYNRPVGELHLRQAGGGTVNSDSIYLSLPRVGGEAGRGAVNVYCHCLPPSLFTAFTISTGPDRDDPPHFTREMAERGWHGIGDRVVREARPRGRPAKAPEERKEKVTPRLSPDVLAHYRAQGPGWQTRIDEALRKAIGR